jgi:hypothetical protein
LERKGGGGSRERGFGTLEYEKLFLKEIPDALDLVAHAQEFRIEYNTVRTHEALSWNRPMDVCTGLADPNHPTSNQSKTVNYLTRDTLPGRSALRVVIRSRIDPSHELAQFTSGLLDGMLLTLLAQRNELRSARILVVNETLGEGA